MKREKKKNEIYGFSSLSLSLLFLKYKNIMIFFAKAEFIVWNNLFVDCDYYYCINNLCKFNNIVVRGEGSLYGGWNDQPRYIIYYYY